MVGWFQAIPMAVTVRNFLLRFTCRKQSYDLASTNDLTYDCRSIAGADVEEKGKERVKLMTEPLHQCFPYLRKQIEIEENKKTANL